jgi:hypothetical protein
VILCAITILYEMVFIPTVIDDEDLTFGGKPLSAWYEEERRRLSNGSSSSDEERRGRERVRRQCDAHSAKHKK